MQTTNGTVHDEPSRTMRRERVGRVRADRRGRDDPQELVDEPGAYPASTGRAGAPSSASSARRLPSARNSASRNVQRRSHSEMRTSTATAPAAARTTNSPAIAITSTSSIVFRRSEYAAWSARNPIMHASESGPRIATRASASAVSAAARPRARRRPTSPRAMGRVRLTGCRRSEVTSRMSLTRYAALDAAQ